MLELSVTGQARQRWCERLARLASGEVDLGARRLQKRRVGPDHSQRLAPIGQLLSRRRRLLEHGIFHIHLWQLNL